MKNEGYKPTRVIDGYDMKKHLNGGFRILEYFHFSNEKYVRKRCIAKHLNLSEAESLMYKLESKLNN